MRVRATRVAVALLVVLILHLVLQQLTYFTKERAWLLLQHGPLTLRRRPEPMFADLEPVPERRLAYATLVNNARYVELCAVLAASLRASGSEHPLLVLALPEALRPGTGIDALSSMSGVTVVPVRPLPITPNIRLDQPHWLYAFAKLRVWQLTQYSRIVYIDGDSLVLRNLDYLFGVPLEANSIAAARDVHACNQTRVVPRMMSSLMVLSPSQAIFDGLKTLMPRSHWNNGDQQLIRSFFTRHGGGVHLLNETDAAFVHRCRCPDFTAGHPGNASGPAVVHFTTAFAPQWDVEAGHASTRRMEPHGWCKTRAGSVSCTHCADVAYDLWVSMRRGLG